MENIEIKPAKRKKTLEPVEVRYTRSLLSPGELRKMMRQETSEPRPDYVVPQFAEEPLSGHPMFHTLLREMAEIHAAKNKDYAGKDYFSNFKMCEDIGIPSWKGVFIRMTDKFSRIVNLIANNREAHVKTESLEDTLIDLANYAIITLILLKEENSDQSTAEKKG
jgi:hypothetical protein